MLHCVPFDGFVPVAWTSDFRRPPRARPGPWRCAVPVASRSSKRGSTAAPPRTRLAALYALAQRRQLSLHLGSALDRRLPLRFGPASGSLLAGGRARAVSRPPDAPPPRHPVGVRPAHVGPPAAPNRILALHCSVTQGRQLPLCLGGALDSLRRAAPRPPASRPARAEPRLLVHAACAPCSLSQRCQLSLCLGGAPDRLLALRLSLASGGLLA